MIVRAMFFILAALVSAAHADTYPIDLDRECLGGAIEKASPERAALACTTILDSRTVHPEHVLDYVVARAGHYRDAGRFGKALADLGGAIAKRPDDARLYNDSCWTRATWGQELVEALIDCDTSLQFRPDDPDTLDSRALVFFRRGDYHDAIRDCDAVLAQRPKFARSLYVRGLSRLKARGAAGGDADIAAAKAIDPKIADEYARYGVTP